MSAARYVPNFVTSSGGRPLQRLGPWRLKRAYTDSSLSARWTEECVEVQPSLKDFLKEVDEHCKLIENLTGEPEGATTRSLSSCCPATHEKDDDWKLASFRVSIARLWIWCRTRSGQIVFPMALTGMINTVALATQCYLFAKIEGTTIILPAHAPTKQKIAVLLAVIAMSTAFVMSFAWISVYSVSTFAKISTLRHLANFMSALIVAILLTFWTVSIVIPMLHHD